MLDILFVHPGASGIIYQSLSDRFCAIEPPTWSLLMAESCRSVGLEVNIIDCDAEKLSDEEATKKIIADHPRLVVMPVYGSNPNAGTVKMTQVETLCQSIKSADPSIVIAVGGTHPSALPEKTLRDHSAIDVVLLGDGVFATIELANKIKNNQFSESFSVPGTGERIGGIPVLHAGGKVVPQSDMDKVMPGYAWDLLPKKKNLLDMYRSCNWHADFKDEVREPYAAIYTSLGCRFKCLRGDTLVNTAYGKLSIKHIAENYVTIPVYTYKEGNVFISDAINIQKTGVGQKLVRVTFDDGTHIDCTPDHKFLMFKNGNQSIKTREFEVEAKDLVPGSSVRALKEKISPFGYKIISWGRRKDARNCRLVMSHKCKRALKRTEHVHHVDRNKINDDPLNLELCSSAKEHWSKHPEMSERMRMNNPSKNMTEEWRNNISVSGRGKTRTLEQRLNYRESKLGEKNPNFIDGETSGRTSRIKEINHKIAKVEVLDDTDDVYCMSVPETGWFFANDVLVKNCSFCIINSINRETTDGDYDASKSTGMRFWSPDQMFNVVKHLYENGVRTIRLSDEMFFLDKRYFEPFLQKLADSGMGKYLQMWAYARVDTVRPKYLDLFYKAGVKWLALGIEAANTAVRREVTKGTFEETDIRTIVKQIQESGISVISNYIFGFPDDTYDTMNQTLDLALELNTEMANMYACSALPGSPLYRIAIDNKWDIPDNYAAWSFHSYESLPLPTKYLSAAEVLKFRDQSWNLYFNRPEFHKVVREKFGTVAEQHVKDMAAIKLQRKIFES